MIVYILCFIVLFLCFIHVLMNHNAKARLLKKIPGAKDVFLIGNAMEFMKSPVELFKSGRLNVKTYGDIYRFHAFPHGAVNICNPDDIEVILSTTKHNNKSEIYGFAQPWIGDGLLLSKGTKWHQRRKILTPTFHFNILRQFFIVLEESSNRLIKILEAKSSKPVDIAPVLSEYTLTAICETAMGTQLSDETSVAARSYKTSIYELGKLLVYRASRIYYHSDFTFNLSSAGRKQREHINTIRDFTKRVIEDRRDYIEKNGIKSNEDFADKDVFISQKKKTAILDLLLLAEKDGHIDAAGVQEEVDTFMFGGHDTTESALTFCLMSLAENTHIQDKILAEQKEIFGDTLRSPKFEDLANMRYLECCIKESLRLYPPVHVMSRTLNETVKLSNYTVPAGIACNIHIYDLHRREDLYKDALKFDPDRFLPDNCVKRHPYGYLPFSAGPRNCLGQKFAMMQMKLVLTVILRNFELVPVTRSSDIEIKADLILRNSKPVYVSFKKKNT